MRALAMLLAVTAGLAAQVKLPPFTRTVLPNGAVLDLLPKKDVPMITIRVQFRGGMEADPSGMAGLGSVTAELLRHGTSTRTADQFSEQLDFIGASFSAGVDEQSSYAGMDFPSREADRGLDLFGDALMKPTFPEA